MATLCEYFRDLEERVNGLTVKFVEDQITDESADPVGFAPDIDRLAAFRLLAHAEIEEFLEAKAKEGLASLRASLSAPGMALRSVVDVFSLACAVEVRLSVSWPFDMTAFLKQTDQVVQAAATAITKNNGVKGTSFFLLSLISGKLPDEVDQALGSSLTSYGKIRGDVAHKSASRVRTLQAPSAEAKAVADLVTALSIYFDVRSA